MPADELDVGGANDADAGDALGKGSRDYSPVFSSLHRLSSSK